MVSKKFNVLRITKLKKADCYYISISILKVVNFNLILLSIPEQYVYSIRLFFKSLN